MHSKKLLPSVFVFILMALSCNQKTSNTANKDTEEKIKQVESGLAGWVHIKDSVSTWTLKQRMDYYKIRGLSIAVVQDYKIVWAKGYGWADTATKKTVTTETLFQAGSISKSLNAVGVLKLVQDKKLDLYTVINTYLQSWKFPYDSVSKGKKITLINLLSHTAGLTLHGFPGYANGDTIPSLPEILNGKAPANTEAVRSAFEPGLRFQYSGGGTTISQLIVEDVTKQPYAMYQWEQVLKPLGMKMSSYTQPPAKDKQSLLATGYRADGKEVDTKFHVYPEQAAAGLWTNPTDLATYIIETQLSLNGKSNKVLSQEMTKLRLTPYIDSSAALGVFIDKKGNEKYFGHNGADEGFLSAYTGSFENGNGVVVMVNSDNGSILNEVINSVATVYGWKDYYKPVEKIIVTVPDNIVNAYAGNYVLNGDTIIISRKANEDFLTVNKRDVFRIWYSSVTEFFSKDIAIEFIVEKDATGKVSSFYFMQQGKKIVARKL